MSVYYKFNSELNYSYVDFDGLHISVSDLKKAILHQKRLGKADFDLLISNAQTKEEYKDEHGLIPKNTSLIVARVPISNQNKKSWETAQSSAERAPQNPSTESINHDISRMNGTEEDKIQAMMMQSTLDYDPTNYQRVRGTTQTGDVPQNYRCHKCNKPGHWIKNCPLNVPGKEHHHFKTRPESKKMTGIPRSLRDNIGAENQEPTQNQFIEEKLEIPEDLVCAICKGIFKDAVMTPCCGSSFCDECVRTALLESEDNECPAPDCREKGTSPGSLIPNRFLRNAVVDFQTKSSNVMSRDSQKKPSEEPIIQDDFEEPAVELEPMVTGVEKHSEELETYDENPEKESIEVEITPVVAEKDSESDDDDNITVTVPPAYQQSRGASFRDSRLRRIPSHGMGEYHESFSHSSSKSHQDDGESYEEENSESFQRQHSGSKRSNHHGYEHSSANPPQGITTLVGEDKGGSQNYHHSTTGASNQNMPHGDSQNAYQQHQQPPPIYNQNQHQNHSGMMSQMHSLSMYPQAPYHQQTGPYYPPNQIRPMRFDHHGNYPAPIRHHHVQQSMMRPSMHDNYNMRHQRPPINHLANAVTHNIQQRYGTGFIDDPLEAFNRIMREKELRKERYRRSPIHNSERRSRSFDRKRSPAHPYSPDNRRQKNYSKVRKRSRSFKSNSDSRSRSRSRNRSARGRSKSRSYSPRYRRKENVQHKDKRDERHRSPDRRGNHHSNRTSSRSNNFKGDSSYKQGLRDLQENQQHEHIQHEANEQNYDYSKESNVFEASHNFDEQPPPPGDESELHNLQVSPAIHESQEKNSKAGFDDAPKEINGSNKSEGEGKRADHDQKKSDHHHHHKKSRGKNYETSSDDKKVRDKKKRKKSREHEKKKSKKDRKDRSEKDKEKKTSSKAGSLDKTPEPSVSDSVSFEKQDHVEPDETRLHSSNKNETDTFAFEEPETPDIEDDPVDVSFKSHSEKLKRSDSILDINPNVDLDMDEWITPEVSKWEREENKSLDNSEMDVGNGDVKKNPEEKVTLEIIKRAENAIFARAISDIRPMENKKFKSIQEHDSVAARKETSPITSVIKRADNAKDSKIQAFQVTVPANDSGNRSIELRTSESSKKNSPVKTSIKNRLGIKIIEKKSRSKSPSRSPKRRLESDCTKVVRSSRDRDRGVRGAQIVRSVHPSSENQRNRHVSSAIKVSRDARDLSRNSRSRYNNKRRSLTPDERKVGAKRRSRGSKSRSNSRDFNRRRDHRLNVDRNSRKPKETARIDEKSSKVPDQSLSDNEKAKTSRQNIQPSIKKRSRDPSSSSTSSASSSGSQKHSKRHGKHKVKKKSRSLSADSNSNSKRKKSKKDKKAKKKKKSRK